MITHLLYHPSNHIQKTDTDIIFNYVQRPDYAYDLRDDIISGLSSRLGDMNYTVNKVDQIERDSKSQKIKSIINEVAK